MKLLSWNILQGGGRRADGIAKVILDHAPDIITLQEFRDSSDKRGGKDEIMEVLKQLGHKFIHIPETDGPHEHTILISSRFGFDAGPFLPDKVSPLPMLEAYFGKEALGFEFSMIAVHFPQKKAQIPLFEALKKDSESLMWIVIVRPLYRPNIIRIFCMLAGLIVGAPAIQTPANLPGSARELGTAFAMTKSWRRRHLMAGLRAASMITPRAK